MATIYTIYFNEYLALYLWVSYGSPNNNYFHKHYKPINLCNWYAFCFRCCKNYFFK